MADKDEYAIAIANAGLSAADLEALKEAGDELFTGDEPVLITDATGDNAPPEEAPPVAVKKEEPAPEAKTEAPAEPAKADALHPEPDTTPAASVPSYVTIKQTDLDAASQALAAAKADLERVNAERAELLAKVEAGDLSTTDFIVKDAAITAARDKAKDAIATSERTIDRHAAQVEQQQAVMQQRWDDAVTSFVDEKAHNIYKANDVMDMVFRSKVGEVGRELIEKKLDWTPRQILTEAHKRVVTAMPGMFAAPAPTTTVAAVEDKAAKTKTPAAPISIAALPSAATTEVKGKFADLDGLDGAALERAIARMSPAEQEEYAAAA